MKSTRWMIAPLLLAASATVVLAGSDVDNIRAAREKYNAAIARHDADALKSFLDEDYVITISTGYIQRSRNEYVSSFATHFEEFPDVVYVRTPTDIALSNAYPLAIEHGTWVGSRTDKHGKVENGGQYTAAWKKTDGTWRVYSELFVGLYCRGGDC